MSVALLFPGQGSQHIGMGKELAQFHSGAARVFKEADRILGFKLSEIMWEGSESELQQTKYAQPAIMIHSVATFSAIEDLFEEPAVAREDPEDRGADIFGDVRPHSLPPLAEEEPEEVDPNKVAKSQFLPSQSDVEDHRTDHLPYTDWCDDCVMG